ncbi:hypothetical protein RRG08_003180 [Elysia crispata]|uniref:Uncharacterized protein n=1 Tax=Elysia crispata TaxID=231223 RepID=A0AAE1EAY5_9GAST|nr:hypothetical protein RRG08_003180 [Elysia crispata]
MERKACYTGPARSLRSECSAVQRRQRPGRVGSISVRHRSAEVLASACLDLLLSFTWTRFCQSDVPSGHHGVAPRLATWFDTVAGQPHASASVLC